MENLTINHLAIISAALCMFIVGGIWYSPALFGKYWLKVLGKNESFLHTGNKAKIFGGSFFLALVSAYILAGFVSGCHEWHWGLIGGLLMGFDWLATSLGIVYLFERKIVRPFWDQCRLPDRILYSHGLDSRVLEISLFIEGILPKAKPMTHPKKILFAFLIIHLYGFPQKKDTLKNLLDEGNISTALNERDFTVAPDGSEIYFTRSHFDNKTRAILTAKKNGEDFGTPEVASFSGKFNDLEPFFSPSGERLYFASNRNTDQTSEKEDYDIWYVERQANGKWGTAVRLADIINSDKDEFYPAVTANGNIYFTASRENGLGAEDIFMGKFVSGTYEEVIPLGMQINSKRYEFNAYVNPDENLIIFSSYGREDDMGGGDLYYSRKNKNGDWETAKNLGNSINSNSLDYCPYYDRSEQTLYYTSNRSLDRTEVLTVKGLERKALNVLNGYGNIYKVKLILK